MQIFKEWKCHSQPTQEAMDGVEKCPWMAAAEGSCAGGFTDSESKAGFIGGKGFREQS